MWKSSVVTVNNENIKGVSRIDVMCGDEENQVKVVCKNFKSEILKVIYLLVKDGLFLNFNCKSKHFDTSNECIIIGNVQKCKVRDIINLDGKVFQSKVITDTDFTIDIDTLINKAKSKDYSILNIRGNLDNLWLGVKDIPIYVIYYGDIDYLFSKKIIYMKGNIELLEMCKRCYCTNREIKGIKRKNNNIFFKNF